VGFDGAFDERESEPGAFDLGLRMVFLDAVESLEDEGEVFGRNADAIVHDLDGEVTGIGHFG